MMHIPSISLPRGDFERDANGTLVDCNTGDIYDTLSSHELRLRCASALITNLIGNSVNLMATLGYRLLATMGKISAIAKDALGHLVQQNGRPLSQHLIAVVGEAGDFFTEIFRLPCCLAAIELAAAYGLADPYNGRKWIYLLEGYFVKRLHPQFAPIGHVDN